MVEQDNQPEKSKQLDDAEALPKQDWRDVPEAVLARRWIIIATVVGMTLPFVLIFIVHTLTKS